jgi:site-specific recombinase XerD
MLRLTSGKNIHNFYLQPLETPTATKWYKDQALGKNSLGNVTKKLFDNAGISGHFTNHSLRRSKVSRMFQAGADKEEIKSQTGRE